MLKIISLETHILLLYGSFMAAEPMAVFVY